MYDRLYLTLVYHSVCSGFCGCSNCVLDDDSNEEDSDKSYSKDVIRIVHLVCQLQYTLPGTF